MSNFTAEMLSEHCQKIGIDGFLSDLDGTVIETPQAFDLGISRSSITIATLVGRHPDEVEKQIRHLATVGLQIPGVAVRPDRWKTHVIPELAKHYELAEGVVVEAILAHFEAIYTTPVDLVCGAEEIFPLIVESTPFAFVSHSASDYMDWKILAHGLGHWGPSVATDPNLVHKDWKNAYQTLGIDNLSRIIVFGDNPRSDIWESRVEGMGSNPKQIWFDRKGLSKIDKTPDLPPGTQIITSLYELPQAILGLR